MRPEAQATTSTRSGCSAQTSAPSAAATFAGQGFASVSRASQIRSADLIPRNTRPVFSR